MPTTQALPLRRIRISRGRASGDGDTMLPFLKGGRVDIKLQSPLTLLVGENGSGKTTLLEAIAARCAAPPSGGESYREIDNDRPETAASQAVKVEFSRGRPRGWFNRAGQHQRRRVRCLFDYSPRLAQHSGWRRLHCSERALRCGSGNAPPPRCLPGTGRAPRIPSLAGTGGRSAGLKPSGAPSHFGSTSRQSH
jgi:hypothetical protein